MTRRLTKKIVLEALEKNGGLRTQAAIELGVTGQALDYWMRKEPDLANARQAALEKLKDVAEAHLFKAVMSGDKHWTQYFLDHHARDRGYGQKLQLTGKNDAPLFDPQAFAAFLEGLSDEQRQAFDTLRSASGPDGVAAVVSRH